MMIPRNSAVMIPVMLYRMNIAIELRTNLTRQYDMNVVPVLGALPGLPPPGILLVPKLDMEI